jgi:hypothetical protein
MTRQGKTRPVSRGEAGEFYRASLELMGEAQSAGQSKSRRASGILAVHAVIAGADAVLGSRFGLRSAASDHKATADLLEVQAPPHQADEWRRQAERIRRVLAKKNLVEYEGRPVSEEEARTLLLNAERFLEWVKANYRRS